MNQLNFMDFMKIKFDTNNDDLPLGKVLSFPIWIIVVKSVFQNENKFYQQVHIHECEYNVSMNYKKYAQHLFTFLKTLSFNSSQKTFFCTIFIYINGKYQRNKQ